jgi:hypothetical protein
MHTATEETKFPAEIRQEAIKHSAAIHVENNMTLLQRRAWNVLLYNAYNFLPTQESYQISVRTLCDILDFNSNNAEYLKEALRALVGLRVEWNVLNKDGKDVWGVATLLADAEIEDGICTYSYGAQFRKRLYNPRIYARIDLSLQNKFENKYAQALWELCVDYLGAGREYGETSYIPVVQFRKLMGIAEHSYPGMKKLNQRVLKPAIAEINKVSDLKVEVEHQRQGRKVTALKFKIRRMILLPVVDGKQNTLFPDLDDMPVAVELLKEAGLSADEAWAIWQQNFNYVDAGKRPAKMGDETDAAFTRYIREKVDLLKRQGQGKVKSATGFLLKAIRENWANPDFAEREKKAAEWRAIVAKQEQQKQLEQEKAQLERAYSDACDAVYEAILQGHPDALAGLIQAAIEANPFLRRYCEGETPEAQYRESMAVAGAVHTLMKERFSDRFQAINNEYQPRLDALDSQINALG